MAKHFSQPPEQLEDTSEFSMPTAPRAPSSRPDSRREENTTRYGATAAGDGEVLYKHRHKVKKSHPAKVIALAILAVVLITAGAGGVFAFNLYKSANAAKGHINSIIGTASSLSDGDLSAALASISSSVDSIQQDAAAAKSEVSTPLWDFAAGLPFIGTDITSVRSAAGILDDFAQTTLPEIQDVSSTLLDSQFSDGDGGLNLEPVINVASKLTTVNNGLSSQAKALEAIPDSKIPQIQSALEKGRAKLTDVSDTVNSLTGLVNMMPSFLGKDGQRKYLVLAQTNSEIRSSGGLVGSIGSFTAENGSINFGDFHSDSEFTQGNVADLVGTNQAELWRSRGFGYYAINITCSPDFPQVAQMAASYWKQQSFGAADEIDGVMSLDPVALGALLDVTGPITLSDGRVLDSSNCADFLLNGVYNAMAIAETDAYFAETASQVIEQTFSDMSSGKLMSLAKKMLSLAENRHVYLWSFHDEDVDILRNAGLTHEITSDAMNPVAGFYLNDVVGTKIDYYWDRSTEISRLANSDMGAQYHIKVTMTNTMTSDELAAISSYIKDDNPDGTIYDDVVLFTPTGGSISNVRTSAGTAFDTLEAYDRTCYHGSLAVGMGQTITIEWDVTCAPGAAPLVFDQTPTISTDARVTYDY